MATAKKKNFAPEEPAFDELDNTEQRNRENGEALGVTDGPVFDGDVKRQKKETQQEYNERVPVAFQPATDGPTHSYLGKKL